ncbi:sulfotransferase family protein [Thermomonospora cellulosilytica]|nr:sulfotransferase family protein [Thermomonospora cellulosilytica]
MLQVIGAGFPRTGTSSMKAALELLGFGPCHHMFEVIMRPGLAERWLAVGEGGTPDWEHVFEGYRSAVDWPAGFYWRELAEAYPQAKVLLTVRDPHRWFASMHTIMDAARQTIPPDVQGPLKVMGDLRPMLDRMWTRTFGAPVDQPPGEEKAVEVFERHTRLVREAVPAERLLVYEVGRGWEPLCEFLGVPVPDAPFPHLNDSAAMRRMFEDAVGGGPMVTPFGTVRGG